MVLIYRAVKEQSSYGQASSAGAPICEGLQIEKHIPDAELRALIGRLWPHKCGKELIRIGGGGDGGYLIPDDLEGLEYCFSPGVSTVADFESHLADLGIRSFMADYSVDGPPVKRPEFFFDKKFLGSTDNERHVTLSTWKNKYLKEYAGDLLLQMDIEGSEYEVIANTPDDLLAQFRMIVIEFHDLHKLFEPFFFKLFDSCLTKLEKHFHIVHLHPNNCCGSARKRDLDVPRVLEATFYNRKRVPRTLGAAVLPNVLDRDNLPSNKPLYLSKSWGAGLLGSPTRS